MIFETMYEPFRIGSCLIPNRLVHSATFEFAAKEGRITPAIEQFYEAAARGGSGLIISGMENISPTSGFGSLSVHTRYPEYVQDMARIGRIVHSYGAKLFVQLSHCGYRTDWQHGYDTFGPSELAVSPEQTYHAMTEEEIEKLLVDFAVSARLCQEAGCDGVQIHGAHGFLLHAFLSPYYNHRHDDWGGSIANRSRLLLDVCRVVAAAAGPDFPISVKLSFQDLLSPGISVEDMLWVCRKLAAQGISMLEISAGMTMDGTAASFSPIRFEGEGPFREYAALAARYVSIPVVSVGGYRSPLYMERTLRQTGIAAVAMCRPLIREPDLPNRWKTQNVPAACCSCNRCFSSPGIVSCQAL